MVKRDKVNLDIFWLKDKSLEGADDLPQPEVIVKEIVDDPEAALEQFRATAEELNGKLTQDRTKMYYSAEFNILRYS